MVIVVNKKHILKKVSLYDHLFITSGKAYKIVREQYNQIPTLAYLAALAGLLHDLGKHPNFYPFENNRYHYRSCDHPLYSADAASFFITSLNLNPGLLTPVLDAITKHHQDSHWDTKTSSIPPLNWILRQADRMARLEELTATKTPPWKPAAIYEKKQHCFSVIDEKYQTEKPLSSGTKRPLNLTKIEPVPSELKSLEKTRYFLREKLAPQINRYTQTITNHDLHTDNPIYGCFTFGNDLMVRMSLIELLWEEYGKDHGKGLGTSGSRYPMQLAIKGLLQHLDQVMPGLVQRPLLPSYLAFLVIQIQQGRDRWTKDANYIPMDLKIFCELTGAAASELERRKQIELNLSGKDYLARICGWRRSS